MKNYHFITFKNIFYFEVKFVSFQVTGKTDDQAATDAAIKIQSTFRGHQARKNKQTERKRWCYVEKLEALCYVK